MSSDRPLVQWTFLQYKKAAKTATTSAPIPCFLNSSTQIGSKILIFGGCDYNGEPQNQLFIYDTVAFQWSALGDSSAFQEDHPGPRYGHTATLVEMHPPKIMIWGGMVGGGTFEFDAPDSAVENDVPGTGRSRSFMSWRRKGKKANFIEEVDEAVYFLHLNQDKWTWSKPLVHGPRESKPLARAEHSACKSGTNEVTIFGGWTDKPMNDLWTFNYVDMEWKQVVTQGIQPRPRFRHTCEIIGYKMYILGGSESIDDVADGAKQLSIHELNLSTMCWSHPTLQGTNPFPRSGHSSAVIGANSIAVFGGKRNNEVYLNDLTLIDLSTYSTTVVNAVEAHLPTPVANSTLNVVGDKVFVFGGTDAKGNCYNDIRSLEVGYYLNNNDITVNAGASSDYSFKILIIGDASVGKSAILTRFSENTFLPSYTSTIGIDFNSRMIRVDKAICKLEIWDTAGGIECACAFCSDVFFGQERFSTITANYYRGAQGALLVYDVALRDSFDHVQNWFDRAKQLGGQDIEAVLVGNKCDLEESRQVGREEGESKAKELRIPFVETSALNGTNIESAFVCMTSNIKNSVDRRGLTGVKQGAHLKKAGGVQLATAEKKSSGCC